MFDLPTESALERRVLLWMCVVIGVNQLGFGAMIPTLPLYAQSFGVSMTAIGLAVAVYGLARCLGALPTGHLADRLGRRPTLAIGGLVSAAGNLACALAPTYPLFLGGRFIAGVGAALVLTTGVVILADITRPQRRGRVMAVYQGVFLFAVGIGPLPGGLMAEKFGLDAPFWAYAVAALVVAVIAWFAVPESRGMQEEANAASGKVVIPFRAQLKVLSTRIGFLLVGALSFMHAFTRTGGVFSVIPLLGAGVLGLSASDIGLGMAIGSVLGLLVVYPSGVMVDLYGRKAVIVPTSILTAFSFVLFWYADGYLWFITASALWGVVSSMGGSAPAAYAADSAPPGMNAAAMASFRTLSDLGYVVGPIAMGMMADAYGPGEALLVAGAMLLAFGVLFAMFAPETYRRDTSAPTG